MFRTVLAATAAVCAVSLSNVSAQTTTPGSTSGVQNGTSQFQNPTADNQGRTTGNQSTPSATQGSTGVQSQPGTQGMMPGSYMQNNPAMGGYYPGNGMTNYSPCGGVMQTSHMAPSQGYAGNYGYNPGHAGSYAGMSYEGGCGGCQQASSGSYQSADSGCCGGKKKRGRR